MAEPKLNDELLKIELIKQNMKYCQDVTDGITNILQNFEDKLESLEKTMVPIHYATQKLVVTQKNLEHTIFAVDEIIVHNERASKAKSMISSLSLEEDFQEYLRLIDNLRQSKEFFVRNSNLKNYNERLKDLRDALRSGIEQCDIVFTKWMGYYQFYDPARLLSPDIWNKRIISDADSFAPSYSESATRRKNTGLRQSHATVPTMASSEMDGGEEGDGEEDIEDMLTSIIKDSEVERTGEVARRLINNKKLSCLGTLITERSKRLLNFSEYVASDGSRMNPLVREHKKGKHGRPRSPTRGVLHIINHAEPLDQLQSRRYVQGTHRSIFLVRILLYILRLEDKVFADVVMTYAKLSQTDYRYMFFKAIEPSIDYIVRKILKNIKEETFDRVVVALDCLKTTQKFLPQFLKVLEPLQGSVSIGNKHRWESLWDTSKKEEAKTVVGQERKKGVLQVEKIISLRDRICEVVGQALSDSENLIRRLQRVKRHKKKGRSNLEDGTVHVITIKTLNFVLRYLYPYKATLESKDMQTVKQIVRIKKSFQAQSTMGSVILWMLHALRNTIMDIAVKQIHNPAKGWLFRLNNLNFVHKKIMESKEVLRSDIHRKSFNETYQNLIEEARKGYIDESWNRALEAMADDWDIIEGHCQRRWSEGKTVYDPDSWAKKAIKQKFKDFNEHFGMQFRSTMRV